MGSFVTNKLPNRPFFFCVAGDTMALGLVAFLTLVEFLGLVELPVLLEVVSLRALLDSIEVFVLEVNIVRALPVVVFMLEEVVARPLPVSLGVS